MTTPGKSEKVGEISNPDGGWNAALWVSNSENGGLSKGVEPSLGDVLVALSETIDVLVVGISGSS